METQEILSINPLKLWDSYKIKWNADTDDFVCLARGEKLVNNNIFRVGGLNNPKPNEDYFTLIKCVEAFYPDDITKVKKDKPHLESRWTIFDKDGNEKVECPPYEYPYLIGGLLYSVRGYIYI